MNRDGWHYCRLRAKSKFPLEKAWMEKCVSDTDVVREWIANGDNIGLVCSRSGIVVVDVDVKNGGVDAWAAMCLVHGEPKTLTQTTPNGGKHYFFKAKPGQSYRGKIQEGIDIRYNAYVVLPPSKLPTGAYNYVDRNAEVASYPEWLDGLIEKKAINPKDILPSVTSSYALSLAKEIKKFELSYEEWVQVGMGFHSSDPSNEGLSCFIEASSGPSYSSGDEEKCIAKWGGFSSNRTEGITILTIMHLIRQKGGTIPPTCTTEDFDIVKQISPGWTDENGKFITHDIDTCNDHFNLHYSYFRGSKNKSCIIINGSNSIINLDKFQLDTSPYVFRVQKGKKIKDELACNLWMNSHKRKEIDAIVFSANSNERQINLYTGFDHIQPIEGNPQAVLDLLYKALCFSPSAADWLLDFLAHMVQKPWEKPSIVPTHVTPEGLGKNILYEMVMKKILGKYFITASKKSDLSTNFNMHLANKFLTFIDESTWGGNREEAEILKKLTGSDSIMVEEKYGARFEISNPSRYVVASNNVNAVKVGTSNRRFFIIEAVEEMQGRVDFFHPIAETIRNTDEVEKFYYLLLNRDISKFNPHTLPFTNEGIDTKITSLGAVGEFWRSVIEDPIPMWYAKGLFQREVYKRFSSWRTEVNHWDNKITPINFWRTTREMVGIPMEPKSVRFGGGIEKFIDVDPYVFIASIEKKIKVNFNKASQSAYYCEEF